MKDNISILLSLGCVALLGGCNSGGNLNSHASTQNVIKKSMIQLGNNNPNCITDDDSNPTTETCVFVDGMGNLLTPSWANYVSFVGAGGGGGGSGSYLIDTTHTGNRGPSSTLHDRLNYPIGSGIVLSYSVGNGGGGGAYGSGSGNAEGGSGYNNGENGYSNNHFSWGGAGGSGYPTSVSIATTSNVIFETNSGYGADSYSQSKPIIYGGAGFGDIVPRFEPEVDIYTGVFVNGGSPGDPSGTDNPSNGGYGHNGFIAMTFSKNPIPTSFQDTTLFPTGASYLFNNGTHRFCMITGIPDNSNTDGYYSNAIFNADCANWSYGATSVAKIAHSSVITLPGSTFSVDGNDFLQISNTSAAKSFNLPQGSWEQNCRKAFFNIVPMANVYQLWTDVNVHFTKLTASCLSNDGNNYYKTSALITPGNSGGQCHEVNGNLFCSGNQGLGFQPPNGDWSNKCHGANYDGVYLKAQCDGASYRSGARIAPGAFNISNSCTTDGVGNLTCSGNQSGPNQTYPNGLNTSQASWLNSFYMVSATTSQTFNLWGSFGISISPSGVASTCSVNSNNDVSCTPYDLPPGDWQNTCSDSVYDGYTLSAFCDGSSTRSSVIVAPNSSNCSSNDGVLSCQ